MNLLYNTRILSVEEKLQMLKYAHENCTNWWADTLDTSKNFARQKVDLPFEEMLKKLDRFCHFTAILRDRPAKDKYIEVGFSTMSDPSYFLWINLKPEKETEFIKKFNINVEH